MPKRVPSPSKISSFGGVRSKRTIGSSPYQQSSPPILLHSVRRAAYTARLIRNSSCAQEDLNENVHPFQGKDRFPLRGAIGPRFCIRSIPDEGAAAVPTKHPGPNGLHRRRGPKRQRTRGRRL